MSDSTPATRATRRPGAAPTAQSSSAVLPTPGSPRSTTTPLRPARAASSSPLSAARSGRRSSSITGPHVEPPPRITPPARLTLPADRAPAPRLGAEDLPPATVRGLHFGGPIADGEPAGHELAATEIIDWLSKRHE